MLPKRHLVSENMLLLPSYFRCEHKSHSLFFCFILSFMLALAVEERARQLEMKVHSCRPSVSRNPDIDLKTKREVGSHSFLSVILHLLLFLTSLEFWLQLSTTFLTCPHLASQMYAEQRRSSDNMSARSTDSDRSNASALSRASSASRLSSTSYMSIQSERPRGRLRSVFGGLGLLLYSIIHLQSVTFSLQPCMLIVSLFYFCMPTAACCSLLHVQSLLSSLSHPHTHTHMLPCNIMNLGNVFANTLSSGPSH